MRAVFLSYASQDVDAARRIADALRASGVEVWFDQRELRGGDAWDAKIRRQIHECALFLPVISQHTQDRREGYFRREWRLAVDRLSDMAEDTPFVLPVCVDDTRERGALVPAAFLNVQWTRLASGATPAAFCERVKSLLAPVEPPAQERPTVLARTASPSAAAQPPADIAPAKSIVVLPFENLSPDPDNAYFADGLTEELIADLSKVRTLRVISRTSAMHFRSTTTPLPGIARELNVRYVVEGSVRRAGNSLRITAQLIEAATDIHLWAEKYSGTLDDVFAMQEEVSRAIVGALRIHLDPAERIRLGRRTVSNVEAYDQWMRARSLAVSYSIRGLEGAIARLQEALTGAPGDPLLTATLAWLHCHSGMMGLGGSGAFALAESWAQRALDLDPEVLQGHLALTLIEIVARGRPREALVHAKRALALNPGDPDANQWLSYLYAAIGRHREALALARALKAMDPAEPLWDLWLAWLFGYDGRLDELATVIDSTRQDLTNPHRLWGMAWACAWLGRRQQAIALLESTNASGCFDSYTQQCILLREALRGNRGAFDKALIPELTESARLDGQVASTLAEYFGLFGDLDATLSWLEQAVSRGWINYPLYARTDPFLESLRGEPRFVAFLERVRDQWEHFEL